jgi:hypothetical protein
MADYKDWSFNYSTIYVGERYDGQQDNIRIIIFSPGIPTTFLFREN